MAITERKPIDALASLALEVAKFQRHFPAYTDAEGQAKLPITLAQDLASLRVELACAEIVLEAYEECEGDDD